MRSSTWFPIFTLFSKGRFSCLSSENALDNGIAIFLFLFFFFFVFTFNKTRHQPTKTRTVVFTTLLYGGAHTGPIPKFPIYPRPTSPLFLLLFPSNLLLILRNLNPETVLITHHRSPPKTTHTKTPSKSHRSGDHGGEEALELELLVHLPASKHERRRMAVEVEEFRRIAVEEAVQLADLVRRWLPLQDRLGFRGRLLGLHTMLLLPLLRLRPLLILLLKPKSTFWIDDTHNWRNSSDLLLLLFFNWWISLIRSWWSLLFIEFLFLFYFFPFSCV